MQIIHVCTTGRSRLLEMPKWRNKILASKRLYLPKSKVRNAQETIKHTIFQPDNDSWHMTMPQYFLRILSMSGTWHWIILKRSNNVRRKGATLKTEKMFSRNVSISLYSHKVSYCHILLTCWIT